MPLQIEKIAEHSAVIPGALDAIADLRAGGLKIGSCSGYPARVMERVVALAATNGYVADHVVATDEVPNGRPFPAQALANVIALGIDDVAACVKVDDTVPGILEGRKAGMWTVALTCSGNALGLTYDAFRALSADRLASERRRIATLFAESKPPLPHRHDRRPAGRRRRDQRIAGGRTACHRPARAAPDHVGPGAALDLYFAALLFAEPASASAENTLRDTASRLETVSRGATERFQHRLAGQAPGVDFGRPQST